MCSWFDQQSIHGEHFLTAQINDLKNEDEGKNH